jgi:hypothetical protein
VEFALVTPILVLLLFGIVDFGLVLDHRIALQHGLREGARYAAVHQGCADIRVRTADRAGDINCSDVTVTYDPPVPASAGDNVEISAPFHYDFPFVGRFGVGTIDTTASASARLEMAVPYQGDCTCPP